MSVDLAARIADDLEARWQKAIVAEHDWLLSSDEEELLRQIKVHWPALRDAALAGLAASEEGC